MKADRLKKVLIGITKSNFGGAQRYVFDIALGARAQGYDVAVLCGGDGVLVQKLKTEGIRVITLPYLGRNISIAKDIVSFFFVWKILVQEKPDVFHINSSKLGGIGSFLGRISRIPRVIFTAHGWAFNEPRPFWQKSFIKIFTWLTILFADKTICVSRKTKHDVEHFPFVKDKLTIIRNGIVPFTLLSRQTARETLVPEISPDTLLVGTLSELHRVKGLDVLLQSWREFKKTHDGILVLVGNGEEEQKLKNMSRDMNISESVYFSGFIENARELLSGFDIFTLPSRSEALPYAPLEAGIASLSVIATRVGGIPEIIENEKTGILITKENSHELTEALTLLSQNKNIREKLGHALHQFVLDNYSQEKMLYLTLETYV
jgi:glycosyltransferase involved in cell wall biosynthesis